MNSTSTSTDTRYSRVLHGLAVALTIAVFPLIWVGGLVTTYDAGMAVPDWPNTYGYNMFAYPASTWLFGPFDLLVEHSHRLLGTVAGLLSIGLVVAAVSYEKRAWFRWWTVAVLLSVIAQGALGGARVVLDQRTFAMIHGCTGPLFFAMATATAVMSSRWWLARRKSVDSGSSETAVNASPTSSESTFTDSTFTGPRTAWIATLLVVASYLQLILGAQLRHVTGVVSPSLFMGFVHMHLTMAAVVVTLAIILVALTIRRQTPSHVRVPAQILSVIVLVQIGLGITTWIVNYALPWQELTETLARYAILAKGYWESLIVTAHMATGSLIIAIGTVLALRAWRSRIATDAKEVNRKWKQQVT